MLSDELNVPSELKCIVPPEPVGDWLTVTFHCSLCPSENCTVMGEELTNESPSTASEVSLGTLTSLRRCMTVSALPKRVWSTGGPPLSASVPVYCKEPVPKKSAGIGCE